MAAAIAARGLHWAREHLAWVRRHADPATREGQRRIADAEREGSGAAEMEERRAA